MKEIRNLFFKKRKAREKNQRGFSLVELLLVCIILVIILGVIATVVNGLQSSYNQRRARSEQLNDGSATMDLLGRLIRVAGANTTAQALTPTGSSQLRIRADWNPIDSVFTGQYEDVSFLVSNNSLYMRNETTNVLTELTQNVNSLSFRYFNASGVETSTPSQIATVKITLSVGTTSPRTFTSTVLVRKGLQIKSS